MDDQTLIRLLRQDPDAGLRAAMQSYAPLVKAVIGRILPRDPREAEEAVADVFVALWRQAPALARENTPLRPSLDDGLADAIADLAEFDRMSAGPQDLVGALVAAMEPPDRDIFLRKYYLLESSRQIAAALGMSESAVNTRLSRGRDRLRRALLAKGVHPHA